VWLAIPLMAGGLFAFQSSAFGVNHGNHFARGHSHVQTHSHTCNPNEEFHENFHAQMHEHEHGCD